ncbi:MAG TPA: helix-turn-helix transcriptional regulator [Ramlibacter sp.]|uniref:helix-turn-helix transcriptional regulator n=1 Tax=Ramlibacter sp. TaxID=1917967 RepID=UPI002D7F5FFC|nr:helix-turn-helix transcriptional regulator [Ramlibacter sp.]HET8746097.1 helix-turn-helix transcriptional regulator [Ramlibacter sp.]
MDLSEQALHGLIELVYDAAEHPHRWRAVYERLQQVLPVKSIHMLALDKRNGTLSYSDGANLPVEGELAYMQRYQAMDPRLPMVLAKPALTWTHFPQDLPPDMQSLPLYRDFLVPYDRAFGSACVLADTPEASVVFTTLSGAAEGPLPAPALAFLDRLLPHLARACRISLRSFVYSTQALVGHLLVNRLRQPVILAGTGGEVVHMNPAAQQLLRSVDLVQVAQGRLRLPEPHQQELLRRCAELEQDLKAAGRRAQHLEEADFRSLRITAPGREDALYAFYSLLSPQGAMGAFGLRPVVMLLFYHPASAPATDANLLHAVFGLTPAEARIATLLADGMSLKQIADLQGTQHDTVRKQLRSIYEKTSTNRQPELVRLLLHLPHRAVRQ